MHCLEVIIARNAYAAGKEAGAALRKDVNSREARRIFQTKSGDSVTQRRAFEHGYLVGIDDDPQRADREACFCYTPGERQGRECPHWKNA
jgi:hypothetical protein